MGLEVLKLKWPSAVVARRQIFEFTGGLIHPGTMANADSAGVGPDGAFRLGRSVAYHVDPLITWLEKRIVSKKPESPRHKKRSLR
jgi:hypothetical protein